jgi:multicomponent Na+:H+ antiporter subunit E
VTALASIAVRTAVLAVVWWTLAEGRTYLWPAGVAAVAAAVAASLLLSPPGSSPRLRPQGLPGFVAAFLVGSVRGGADVAARAFRRRVDLEPALVDYELRLPSGAARHLFAATVSLLPGTLSVRLAGDVLTVHLLDGGADATEVLGALERRVAALFAGRERPR